MDSVGLLHAHQADTVMADAILMSDQEQQNSMDITAEPSSSPPAPPPPPPPPPPLVPVAPAVPWTIPPNIQFINVGNGFNVMDMGGSVGRLIGKVGAPMAGSGAIRTVCKLPGHSANSKNQCNIWLTAPGCHGAALACIGNWFQDAMVEGADQTKHMTNAAVINAHFKQFVQTLASAWHAARHVAYSTQCSIHLV